MITTTETGKANSIITQRERCLDEAKRIVCTDRNEQYGEPENNFDVIADYWAVYLNGKYKIGVQLDSKNIAHMMVLFKMGRITTAKTYKEDNYIDLAGYAACAMECATNKAKTLREITIDELTRQAICLTLTLVPKNTAGGMLA